MRIISLSLVNRSPTFDFSIEASTAENSATVLDRSLLARNRTLRNIMMDENNWEQVQLFPGTTKWIKNALAPKYRFCKATRRG